MRLAVVSFRLCLSYSPQPQSVTPLKALSLNTGTLRELPLRMAEVEVRWSRRTCLPRWWWIEWEMTLMGSGNWTVGARLGGTVWGGLGGVALLKESHDRQAFGFYCPLLLAVPSLTSWLSLPWGELAQLPVLASMQACCPISFCKLPWWWCVITIKGKRPTHLQGE